MKVLETITHSIKKEFRYGARYEHGVQSATETLALGTGTCRDFAVLMMEALRSYGIAARFVTGYLYDDDLSGATRGGGSTHAWCSIYVPGAGWIEYDPTNGLVAGSNLIRVGATRTASQALPISGGFVGGANDAVGMRVDVSVTAARSVTEQFDDQMSRSGAIDRIRIDVDMDEQIDPRLASDLNCKRKVHLMTVVEIHSSRYRYFCKLVRAVARQSPRTLHCEIVLRAMAGSPRWRGSCVNL